MIHLVFFALCLSCFDSSKVSFLRDYSSTRSLASGDEFECYIDKFDLDYIKADIIKLEKGIGEIELSRREYNHLDLSSGQKKFLNKFYKIVDQSNKAKSCTDFFCLLDSNYQNGNKEQAYRIYHYFLKTGIGIDSKGTVPEWDESNGRFYYHNRVGEIEKYLFTNEQLKFFNVSSYLYADKYLALSVKSMHRTEKGHYIDSTTTGTFYFSYPGGRIRSNFRDSKGYIYLSDQYLLSKNKIFQGAFVKTAFHELTHALDYTYGEELALNGLSEQEEWFDLSWTRHDLSSASTLKSNLKIKSGNKNFVSGYSKKSVKEDFADHGAFYITKPQKLKSIAPKKYNYFKTNIYKDVQYLIDNKFEGIQNSVKDKLLLNIVGFIQSCEDESDARYNEESFLTSLPDSIFSRCLSQEINDFLILESLSIKKNKYEGCYVYDKYAKEIEANAKIAAEDKLNDVLTRYSSFTKLNTRISSYREKLLTICPADYFLLRSPMPSMDEYSFELSKCIENVESDLDQYILKQEVDSYLFQNSYEVISQSINSHLLIGLERVKSGSRELSGKIISKCGLSFKDDKRSISPLNISFLSLNIDFNNCVNQEFDYMSKQFISENFSYDQSKYESLYNFFYSKSQKIIQTSLFTLLESMSVDDSNKIKGYDHQKLQEKYFEMNLLEELVATNISKNSCQIAYRPVLLNDYQEAFIDLGIKALEVNDYVNYYLKMFCDKASFIKSADQLESQKQEKSFVSALGEKFNLFVLKEIKTQRIAFSRQVFVKKCLALALEMDNDFSKIPSTLKSICNNKWERYESVSLSNFYSLAACMPGCSSDFKASSEYTDLISTLEDYLWEKWESNKSLCLDDIQCTKKKTYNNENKLIYADEVGLGVDDKLKSLIKSEFYKVYFKMSIK